MSINSITGILNGATPAAPGVKSAPQAGTSGTRKAPPVKRTLPSGLEITLVRPASGHQATLSSAQVSNAKPASASSVRTQG